MSYLKQNPSLVNSKASLEHSHTPVFCCFPYVVCHSGVLKTFYRSEPSLCYTRAIGEVERFFLSILSGNLQGFSVVLYGRRSESSAHYYMRPKMIRVHFAVFTAGATPTEVADRVSLELRCISSFVHRELPTACFRGIYYVLVCCYDITIFKQAAGPCVVPVNSLCSASARYVG